MKCELIPGATAGHSSGFCGFALAGYAALSPDSTLLTSRDEKQSFSKKKKGLIFSNPCSCRTWKLHLAEWLNLWPLWPNQTCCPIVDVRVSGGRIESVCFPGRGVEPKLGDAVDSAPRTTRGVRLIWRDRRPGPWTEPVFNKQADIIRGLTINTLRLISLAGTILSEFSRHISKHKMQQGRWKWVSQLVGFLCCTLRQSTKDGI